MTILHEEVVNGYTLTVVQEWPGAGLQWRLMKDLGPLGMYRQRSSGRFYMDAPDEKIHGATMADVVETTRQAALSVVHNVTKK